MDRDRQTDRQTDRQRETERWTEIDRQTDRQRETERWTEIGRQTDSWRETDWQERWRETGRQREQSGKNHSPTNYCCPEPARESEVRVCFSHHRSTMWSTALPAFRKPRERQALSRTRRSSSSSSSTSRGTVSLWPLPAQHATPHVHQSSHRVVLLGCVRVSVCSSSSSSQVSNLTIWKPWSHLKDSLCVCVCVCMHVCMRACMYACVLLLLLHGVQLQHYEDSHIFRARWVVLAFPQATKLWHGLQDLECACVIFLHVTMCIHMKDLGL